MTQTSVPTEPQAEASAGARTASRVAAVASVLFGVSFFWTVASVNVPHQATDAELLEWWGKDANVTSGMVSLLFAVFTAVLFAVVTNHVLLLAGERSCSWAAFARSMAAAFTATLLVSAALRGVIGHLVKVEDGPLPGIDVLRYTTALNYTVLAMVVMATFALTSIALGAEGSAAGSWPGGRAMSGSQLPAPSCSRRPPDSSARTRCRLRSSGRCPPLLRSGPMLASRRPSFQSPGPTSRQRSDAAPDHHPGRRHEHDAQDENRHRVGAGVGRACRGLRYPRRRTPRAGEHTPSASPTSPSQSVADPPADVSPLVGTWERTQTCAELVAVLTDNGMERSILQSLAGDGWIPGVTKPGQIEDPGNPCEDAVSRSTPTSSPPTESSVPSMPLAIRSTTGPTHSVARTRWSWVA